MKVIVFLLSHSRHSLKGSKDPSKKAASRLLTSRDLGFGKGYVAPDFSRGSWRGYSVQMAFSWRRRTQIASLLLGRSAFLQRSSNSPVFQGESELLRPVTFELSVSYVPMLFLTISKPFLIRLLIWCGLTSFVASLAGTLTMISSHGMGQGQP